MGTVVAIVLIQFLSISFWAGYRYEIVTPLQLNLCTVPSGRHLYLGTETGRFGQTPFAARGPATIVDHARVYGLTHDRGFLESGMKGPVGWYVDRNGEINQGDTAENHYQLAETDASADSLVLPRNHACLALVPSPHLRKARSVQRLHVD